VRRLTYIPGNVKLWESPGKAGGLPVIITSRTSATSYGCAPDDMFAQAHFVGVVG
jgi:hypothetical protein